MLIFRRLNLSVYSIIIIRWLILGEKQALFFIMMLLLDLLFTCIILNPSSVVLSNVSKIARSLSEGYAASRLVTNVWLDALMLKLVLDAVDLLGEPLGTVLAFESLDLQVSGIEMSLVSIACLVAFSAVSKRAMKFAV